MTDIIQQRISQNKYDLIIGDNRYDYMSFETIWFEEICSNDEKYKKYFDGIFEDFNGLFEKWCKENGFIIVGDIDDGYIMEDLRGNM